MSRLLAACCVVTALFGPISPACADNALQNVARDAFAEFQKKAPGISRATEGLRTPPAVTGHWAFWECSDGETTLAVDLRGNASYSRVRGWSPAALSGETTLSRNIDSGSLVQKTRQLAANWLPADALRALKPAEKRETLLLAKLPGGRIAELPGRTIVRLSGPDDIGEGYFQTVFDPNGGLLRLDISFANARTKDLCNRGLLASAAGPAKMLNEQALTLGCFFDPSEYRFEISACSVEGEPFLKLSQTSNPFGRDNFDLKLPHRVSVERYRNSQDYQWWCWAWWHHYGCVGAFRGDWLDDSGQPGWEYPQRELRHHRSLSSYKTVQGLPRHKKVIPQPDGPAAYPFATSQTFEGAFYRDLEQCNLAFLFTHGGPIQGAYQVRRGLDVWVKLAPPPRKLGVGKLRHLFLDGCAAFTYRREPQSAHLIKTWIRNAPANGLRTVSGVDGGASLLDRTGWRFFGHYNKGDSVSDSWAFALLDEFTENCPATAAYGNTIGEATESLLRGRFVVEKAQAKAVAISIWSTPTAP